MCSIAKRFMKTKHFFLLRGHFSHYQLQQLTANSSNNNNNNKDTNCGFAHIKVDCGVFEFSFVRH